MPSNTKSTSATNGNRRVSLDDAPHERIETLVDEAAGALADQAVDFVFADFLRHRRFIAGRRRRRVWSA